MLARSITALAALALAATVATEPMPYKPQAMKMSVRELFGVVRREDTSGYQPEQTTCNEGNTCAEACGAGYETCSSSDDQVHCFNPTVGEICCPNRSGDSCEAGYKCAADGDGETWCCPDGMSLADCAAAYGVGELKPQAIPLVTTTTTSSSPSSTIVPPTTTKISSATVGTNSTTIAVESSTSTRSYTPSASFGGSNSTAITTVMQPLPTESNITEGAGSIAGPASALVFLVAGLAALL
ncbi:hypothetical protein MMYC01_208707 [Madurella mycetomatis]|uniref:Uncharacterized protein n=1 Tax=Madurella mycetomatis TaxID=100816 RepID=A0A175VTS3_9PEZI|nr:hypothetical protein MMYC01_208707 [Madurella mycetomatis]